MFQVWPKPILDTGQNWSAFDAPKLCWRVQGCGFELLLVFSAHVQEHIGHQKIPIQISWTFSAHLLVSRSWFLLVRMGQIWNCAFSILRVGLRTGHCRSFEDKRICDENQFVLQWNWFWRSQGPDWASSWVMLSTSFRQCFSTFQLSERNCEGFLPKSGCKYTWSKCTTTTTIITTSTSISISINLNLPPTSTTTHLDTCNMQACACSSKGHLPLYKCRRVDAVFKTPTAWWYNIYIHTGVYMQTV